MKLKIFLFIFIPLLIADQWSKHWIVQHLAFGDSIPVLSGFFDLVHYRNTGAAFGMFANWGSPFRELFFYGVFAGAFIFLGYTFLQTPAHHRKTLVALSLIFTGAIGNILDRIFRGSVVDFLLVHWHYETLYFTFLSKLRSIELIWPAFNVADSCITIGVLSLLFLQLRKKT